MIIVGTLTVFYLIAVVMGKRTTKIRAGQYYIIVLLALAQTLIVLVDLLNTPMPIP